MIYIMQALAFRVPFSERSNARLLFESCFSRQTCCAQQINTTSKLQGQTSSHRVHNATANCIRVQVAEPNPKPSQKAKTNYHPSCERETRSNARLHFEVSVLETDQMLHLLLSSSCKDISNARRLFEFSCTTYNTRIGFSSSVSRKT